MEVFDKLGSIRDLGSGYFLYVGVTKLFNGVL